MEHILCCFTHPSSRGALSALQRIRTKNTEYCRKNIWQARRSFFTDIETGIIISPHEVIDFSEISVSDVIAKAVEDAEMFMSAGKYDSAFDRVHTAFHGYLRKKLDDLGETYEESDTLNQLYNKLHTYVGANIAIDQSGLIKTTLRSASGIIS